MILNLIRRTSKIRYGSIHQRLQLTPVCSPLSSSAHSVASRLWRSFFYVPGDKPRMIEKISQLPTKLQPDQFGMLIPDLIVLDCEDAVAIDRKAEARQAVSDALSAPDGGLFRVLRQEFQRHAIDDLVAVLDAAITSSDSSNGMWPGPDLFCLPKVESLDELSWLSDRVDTYISKATSSRSKPQLGLVAMIESCKSVVNLPDICLGGKSLKIPLVGVVFGSDDYCVSLGTNQLDSPQREFEWWYCYLPTKKSPRHGGAAMILWAVVAGTQFPKVQQTSDTNGEQHDKEERVPVLQEAVLQSGLEFIDQRRGRRMWKTFKGSLCLTIRASEALREPGGNTRSPNNVELSYARSYVPVVAKASGLSSIDMVDIDYKDTEKLEENCKHGAQMGFSGKQTIHPAQLPIVNKAFSPSSARIEWSRALLAEAEKHSEGDAIVGSVEEFGAPLVRFIAPSYENTAAVSPNSKVHCHRGVMKGDSLSSKFFTMAMDEILELSTPQRGYRFCVTLFYGFLVTDDWVVCPECQAHLKGKLEASMVELRRASMAINAQKATALVICRDRKHRMTATSVEIFASPRNPPILWVRQTP
ncbi:hypothetical protein T265_07168 [Opisthorchis viverrini]|uniref:HpcH/HpaI aldolase/citrate lyase domain-containing protein n=1 Tax=Opisthorchis viverrini TaxID=6198 RepID=A0A074ZDW6_OPIVI|nr:hypothetical protein T265_07168 [Opisthorchis viverrini]KER25368.1 hypothetical protein T265_07168 [Opisthorchis viverrini]